MSACVSVPCAGVGDFGVVDLSLWTVSDETVLVPSSFCDGISYIQEQFALCPEFWVEQLGVVAMTRSNATMKSSASQFNNRMERSKWWAQILQFQQFMVAGHCTRIHICMTPMSHIMNSNLFTTFQHAE